jgi:hypothetical protein
MANDPDKKPSSDELIRQARERLKAGAEVSEPTSPDTEPDQDTEPDHTPRPTSPRESDLQPPPKSLEVASKPIETRERAARSRKRSRPPGASDKPWYRKGWGRILGLAGLVAFSLFRAGVFSPPTADVEAGDCFNSSAIASSTGLVEVTDLEIVPCEQAHDFETYAVVDYPVARGDDFPGGDALSEYATIECADRFTNFVGVAWIDAGYDIVPLVPSQERWRDGDRELECALIRMDGQPMQATARESGSIVPEGLVSVFWLQEGDCIDGSAWFAFGEPVSCLNAHEFEVYAVLTSPSEPGAAYSSIEEVSQAALRTCGGAFASRVDPDHSQSLDFGPLAFPIPLSWDDGHRSYVCALSGADSESLTGSQLLAATRFVEARDTFSDESTPDADYPNFASISGLNLVGSAHQGNEQLRLTRFAEHALRGAPFQDERAQRGAAWLAEAVSVEEGFDTVFIFQMEMYSWFTIGDGLAFVVQGSGPNALGQEIGYDGMPNSVAIEFDTLRQDWLGDPLSGIPEAPDLLANHVSVQSKGTQPNDRHIRASLGWENLQSVMADRAAHVVVISYRPGEMKVFVDEFDAPALTVDIDLAAALSLDAGSAFVGFTASSGPRITGHKILAWEFVSFDPS